MEDLKEKDLYEPVKNALVKDFENLGECILEITATKISDEIKIYLDDHAVLILGIEGKKPDIMGIVRIRYKSGYTDNRLIIAEVKLGSLSFSNLYQLKKYAEMFNAYYSILISPEGFNEPRRRFLKYRSLLSYFGYRSIWIAQIIDKEYLEYDKLLCGNPIMIESQKMTY